MHLLWRAKNISLPDYARVHGRVIKIIGSASQEERETGQSEDSVKLKRNTAQDLIRRLGRVYARERAILLKQLGALLLHSVRLIIVILADERSLPVAHITRLHRVDRRGRSAPSIGGRAVYIYASRGRAAIWHAYMQRFLGIGASHRIPGRRILRNEARLEIRGDD